MKQVLNTEKHLKNKIINYYLEKNLVTKKKKEKENLLFNNSIVLSVFFVK